MNEEHNKFTEVEILLGGFFTLAVDGVCILIDITGIGAVLIAPIVQGFTTFVLWLWFKSKGDPGAMKMGRQIVKYAANFLPITPVLITALTTSIPFFIEVFIHNHPEKFAAAMKAIRLKSGVSAAKAAEGGLAAKSVAAARAYGKPAGISAAADIAETARTMGIPEP
ncbi:MAG: hypothetical protein V1696_00245 [Candidatus Jorgensenbacteria bacterium]